MAADVQGARSIRSSGIPALFVFIAPPSLEELERRLRGRGTETPQSMTRRITNARQEISRCAKACQQQRLQQLPCKMPHMCVCIGSYAPLLPAAWCAQGIVSPPKCHCVTLLCWCTFWLCSLNERGLFDYLLLNDDLDATSAELERVAEVRPRSTNCTTTLRLQDADLPFKCLRTCVCA